MVPVDITAEMRLRVPFLDLAYPPTLADILEAFVSSEDEEADPLRCRVVCSKPQMITGYICYVRHRSGDSLTEAIERGTLIQ
jgi:hypothetical protein